MDMNESHHNHHHNNSTGFLNGFVLGAVIGAGILFFLGTKRGKELANELSEKSLSALEDFEDAFAESQEDTGATSQTPPQESPTPLTSTTESSSYPQPPLTHTVSTNPTPPHIQALQAHGRHFFHGIPKRR